LPLGPRHSLQNQQIQTLSALDRTQEVGGSSPPSSIFEEALHVRGFRSFGAASGSAVIALRFRH
jgi:hypothetical protein